jgi:hypothetical protein
VPGELPDLQAALDAANHGDTIEVAAGIFNGDGNRNLICDKTVTIRGAGAGSTIFDLAGIQDDDARWLTFVAGSQATIEALSVRHGYAGLGIGGSGGVFHVSDGASPTIIGCHFSSNSAVNSGAVVWSDPVQQIPPTRFTDCEFRDNDAYFAAVVFGNAAFERCLFTGNQTSAVSVIGSGPLAMLDCLVAGNTCTDPLSTALVVDGGWGRTIEGVTVRDNDTYYGICVFGGSQSDPVTLSRCTFYNHVINLSVG